MKLYATMGWTIGDVQSLAPRLTDEQAEAFLQQNQRALVDMLTQYGWECLTTYLHMDGVDMSDPDEEAV
jgi:hypothetical protein